MLYQLKTFYYQIEWIRKMSYWIRIKTFSWMVLVWGAREFNIIGGGILCIWEEEKPGLKGNFKKFIGKF